MRSEHKRRRLFRDEAELDEGAKLEREEAGVEWPLERDEPRVELAHPDRTPADLNPPPAA